MDSRPLAKFQVNPQLVPLLKRSPQILARLGEIAEKVAETVRQNAPVGDSPSGKHYVDQIEVDLGIVNGQVTARVNANKWTANFLEFGTSKMAPRAPLRRGLEANGLRPRGGKH